MKLRNLFEDYDLTDNQQAYDRDGSPAPSYKAFVKKYKIRQEAKLNELSTRLLAKYVKKASKNGMNKAFALGGLPKKKPLDTRQVDNRAKGIATATDKLVKRDWTAEGVKFKSILKEVMGLGNDTMLNHAKHYTMSAGLPDVKPEMQSSSHEKQYPIARAFHVAASEDPEYKQNVFKAYSEQHPDMVKASGAKNYDELVHHSYNAMGKETEGQYNHLSKHINFDFHGGEKDYANSDAMRNDLHNNKHINVFSGGDEHEFLNKTDSNGINSNHKFRAVHDSFGHGILKNGFGPKGEETAWNIHHQMYSDLAKPAMTAETRGQNSWVNYSGVNKDRSPKDTIYAPQKAVLLPPEMNKPDYNGEVPDYLRKHMK